MQNVRNCLRGKGTLLVLIAMILFSTCTFGSTFMSWSNLSNVLRQMSWFGIAAIGVNLCIIAGGRDVSVGYTAMLTGMIFTFCITKLGLNLWIAVLIALCVGPFVGMINGFIIAKLHVRAMIATLSVGWILSSLGLIINNDSTIYISKQTPYINLFYSISDLERIGDHAENLVEAAQYMEEHGLKFSETGIEDLQQISKAAVGAVSHAVSARQENNMEDIRKVSKLEDEVDNLEEEMRDKHIERLSQQTCNPSAGVVFLDILSNLERISDHAYNVAGYVKD